MHSWQREYGTWKAKVGLLTLEQFGKYFDIIPKVDGCWWLATPYVTPLRSSYSGFAEYAWYVFTGGSVNFGGYSYGSRGVRPALILESSLLVSCDDVTDGNVTKLSDYSDEELLEEIKRRFKMTDFISSKNEFGGE